MRKLAEAVVAHYQSVRRDLPWRRTRDPYAIWVSEVMLQQTRVATVIPYWERWMAKFPTVSALAAAPLDDVLASWAGLGFYARARNLWNGAKEIDTRFAGKLPGRASELREVKGIGPYTAGAIASIALGERAPLVDGNVARVLARVFAIPHDIKSSAGTKALWKAAGELMTALPETAAPGDLNQGLMELGATLCSPTSPRCLVCPLAKTCRANLDGRTDELPITAPRKKLSELPLLERTLVWIESGGGIVLARRRPEGLWGGLWELPERAFAERLRTRCDPDDEAVAHHDQVLSHRRLRVTVVRGKLRRNFINNSAIDDPSYDAVARVVDT